MARAGVLALAGALAATLTGARVGAQPAEPVPPTTPPPAEVTETTFRSFLGQKGRVVVEHHVPLPAIELAGGASLVVSGAWAFEPGLENSRLLGVRIELLGTRLPEAERVAYLDLHEIEPLIRAMAFMRDAEGRTTAGVSDARFVSVEGFGVGAGVGRAGVRYYVQLGRDEPVRAGLGAAGFAGLSQRLVQARDRLFEP